MSSMSSKNREIIGNYEVSDKDVVTRREVLIMGALAAGTLAAPALAAGGPISTAPASEAYTAKDFGHLAAKMEGFTASQIEQHIKLYKGYIAKANELGNKLKEVDINGANATYHPLRELLLEESYAVNGVIFHELYFGNLGGKGGEPGGDLRNAIDERFGSIGKFNDYLTAAGKCMRGWVIVGYNTRAGRLDTFGLDMHNMWAPAGIVPVVALDVYEHAYMIDYGIDRAKYLDAFLKNLDWEVAAKRFERARKHTSGPETTA